MCDWKNIQKWPQSYFTIRVPLPDIIIDYKILYKEVNISVKTSSVSWFYIFVRNGRSNHILLRIYKSDNTQQLESFEKIYTLSINHLVNYKKDGAGIFEENRPLLPFEVWHWIIFGTRRLTFKTRKQTLTREEPFLFTKILRQTSRKHKLA